MCNSSQYEANMHKATAHGSFPPDDGMIRTDEINTSLSSHKLPNSVLNP